MLRLLGAEGLRWIKGLTAFRARSANAQGGAFDGKFQ
jgi:hypothetical protein